MKGQGYYRVLIYDNDEAPTMNVLTIHKVPDEALRALRARAARHGRSAEAEARAILQDTVRRDLRPPKRPAKPKESRGLGDELAAIWGKIGLTDSEFAALEQEIAGNKSPHEPMRFDDSS